MISADMILELPAARTLERQENKGTKESHRKISTLSRTGNSNGDKVFLDLAILLSLLNGRHSSLTGCHWGFEPLLSPEPEYIPYDSHNLIAGVERKGNNERDSNDAFMQCPPYWPHGMPQGHHLQDNPQSQPCEAENTSPHGTPHGRTFEAAGPEHKPSQSSRNNHSSDILHFTHIVFKPGGRGGLRSIFRLTAKF